MSMRACCCVEAIFSSLYLLAVNKCHFFVSKVVGMSAEYTVRNKKRELLRCTRINLVDNEIFKVSSSSSLYLLFLSRTEHRAIPNVF